MTEHRAGPRAQPRQLPVRCAALPDRSAMQSGRGKRAWLLEFEPRGCRVVEPLMGWTATDDPTAQLRLKFSRLSAAVNYAEREGLDYDVIEPPARRPIR